MLATSAYAVVNGLQLFALRGSLEETRKSNEYTRESNRLMEQALILSNRAWVTLASIRGVIPAAGLLNAAARLQNTGRSPATNLMMRTAIALRETPFQEDVTIELEGEIPSVVVLPPSGQLTAESSVPQELTPQQVEEIQAGKLLLYFIGQITYNDGLGNRGETSFCGVYRPRDKSWQFTPHSNWVK